ncbi:hypothetical protein MSAS_07760 [Mycobacterium saskatchewanense]|uniref:DUF7159 domain-containing protein n=1 Tax=Mycobacterium saskatchewanense TaxID=220927 RepID=A0AAJ3NMY4_9MYCO|nr:hypothetical protein [Mycobacterium saskatchewanense]ORW69171.1 hypothetical protein AWC23_19555 [Mycobacterium saskatchewanense]BBX61602.1 hypothetical protein MSAS_07760 [Mycobacterium saskatchewanense]
MDTVLGLSVTPTAVGWVLAEGHGADGTILDHRQMPLHAGRGVQAVNTAEQVADEVLRVDAQAAETDHHVRVVGVTWNDDATAQAALVLETLTDAGFDNVVPVRLLEAVDTLARAIAPVIGYEQTAVCILEHEWSTVVMVDTRDGETQTATKQVPGGFDGLTAWLTGMFDRDGWRPGGVVVVGADSEINGLSWQLEKALPVPVFAQTMAQVTVARGAALAAARSTEFTDERLVTPGSAPASAPARSRRWSYTGAVTALAAGAITFVTSLSVAVGIELAPTGAPATPKHPAHAPTPQVAAAVAPAAAPPPQPARPTAQAPDGAPAGQPVEQEAAPAEQQPDASGRQPYLTRVLEHIPGDAGDAAANPEPQAPAQP